VFTVAMLIIGELPARRWQTFVSRNPRINSRMSPLVVYNLGISLWVVLLNVLPVWSVQGGGWISALCPVGYCPRGVGILSRIPGCFALLPHPMLFFDMGSPLGPVAFRCVAIISFLGQLWSHRARQAWARSSGGRRHCRSSGDL